MSILEKRANRNHSRRTFLAGLGAAASVSPFVPLLNASGQEGAKPKRLLLVYTPHGSIYGSWKPTGTETNFQLGTILAPLEKWKSKLCVLGGITMPATGPGAQHTRGLPLLWTGSQLSNDMTFNRSDCAGGCTYGWNTGPSVDQYIVERTKPNTTYASLEFGIRSGSRSVPQSRMIYKSAQTPLTPDSDPYAIFNRLFMNKGAQGKSERQSAIDIIRAELDGLKGKVAAEDQKKLDAHLDSIRGIETRLTAAANLCTGTQAPPSLQGTRVDPNAIDNIPGTFDRQSDLIALAFSCDVTRIASLQYAIGDTDGSAYPFIGINDGHHELSHAGDSDTAARDKLIKIYTWYSQRVSYLLGKLDAIPEGNGTMLDNTMVVWGSEVGKGNDHSYDNTPFVIAGGAGGSIKTGRFLNFPNRASHHRILTAVCNVFGLADVAKFGNTEVSQYGTGPLKGLLG